MKIIIRRSSRSRRRINRKWNKIQKTKEEKKNDFIDGDFEDIDDDNDRKV